MIYNKWYKIFVLDKEKEKPDAKLRFRVRWAKNIVAFSVGFRIDVSKWSTDTQRCKNNTTHGRKKIPASIINREINRYECAAEKLFNYYDSCDIIPTKEKFQADFLKEVRNIDITDHSQEKTLIQVLGEFTLETGFKNSWTSSTYEKFKALKSHILKFKANPTFNDFDERGLNLFIAHLRDVENLRNSTIENQLSFVKWFLRWATAKGYNSIHDFETFSPKFKKTENKVIFLEWDELMNVYNYPFPKSKSYLERVRDVFCFCCFTSLRYSDVENLRWSDVFEDHIVITTIKTNDTVTIELNDYSKGILEKYKGFHFENNKALPVISNQKMNMYLKEVGKICGLDTPVTITYYRGHERIDEVHPKYELLGTHTGRRTFICNALMLGIPADIVMKWTGHSDYKTMRPYIDIADSAKKKAMSLFNKK